MPRHLALGNGRMLINFDDKLNMRDLYYPIVGLSNHILGHKNALGVWVDGTFKWMDAPSWKRHVGYEDEALVSSVTAIHSGLGLELRVCDAVHYRDDLYLKQVVVTNLRAAYRKVRLFFTHDFSIHESDIGDTSLYDLASDAILHYKRDTCFLMSGLAGEAGIFEYANGTKRFGGAEGTWRDAEDGRLEGNPIAQGSVDSAISFELHLDPLGSRTLHYWIAAARNFEDARRLHRHVRREGAPALLDQTRAYWRSWLEKARSDFKDLGDDVAALFKRSLLVIRTQIDRGGAILAANDSDILRFNRDHYSYVWPRDGALVARTLEAAGYSELTREFYRFCRRGMSPGGFLWHKYHPDGSVGSSWHPWLSEDGPQLPIQEDATALVLSALWHFYEAEKDLDFVEGLYASLIKPAADFMTHYRHKQTGLPLESYDLWEERRGVFTFTASAVWAGLQAAARFASLFGQTTRAGKYERAADEVRQGILDHLFAPQLGRFARGLRFKEGEPVLDTTLESSLYGLHAFGVLPADDDRVRATMEQIEEGLAVETSVGGFARYQRDPYFSQGEHPAVPGNPWIICTLWVADWYIARARSKADLERPRQIIEWATRKALPSGILPEQLHPFTGEHLSVAPLTWSHSTFVGTVLNYLKSMDEIEARAQVAETWHTAP